EIIDHQFRGRIFQFRDDLFASGFLLQWKERAERILLAHVWRIAVQNAAHFHNGAGELDRFTENVGAIRRRENGSTNVQANLAAVDVEGRYHLNVARPVAPNLPLHQSNASAVAG